MGIELRPADAHMHTAVAGCERFNKTLRQIARATHFDHGYEWDLILPLAVFWYKQLIHVATGHSPFYLDHGREAVTPWDIQNGPYTSFLRRSTSTFASLLARFTWPGNARRLM